jgi:hypothetical protein
VAYAYERRGVIENLTHYPLFSVAPSAAAYFRNHQSPKPVAVMAVEIRSASAPSFSHSQEVTPSFPSGLMPRYIIERIASQIYGNVYNRSLFRIVPFLQRQNIFSVK